VAREQVDVAQVQVDAVQVHVDVEQDRVVEIQKKRRGRPQKVPTALVIDNIEPAVTTKRRKSPRTN
jgi:hypothetical protein